MDFLQEFRQDSNDEDSVQSEPELFGPKLLVQLRNFKGNSSGPEIGTWQIECASLEEFHQLLWIQVEKHIKREVVFDEQYKPSWHENEVSTFEDLSKFVGFADKKPGKRSYEFQSITTSNLQAWRNRPVCLHIYVFSSSVSSANLYKAVCKELLKPKETDRSGAPSNLITTELANRLKEINVGRYTTTSEIHWDLWANDILGSDAHIREELINGPPPASIIHLFRHVRRNSIETTEPQNVNLPISQAISQDFVRELSNINGKIDNALQLHKELGEALVALYDEFRALTLRCGINQSLVSSMGQAARPVETQSSSDFLNNIHDAVDVDHN